MRSASVCAESYVTRSSASFISCRRRRIFTDARRPAGYRVVYVDETVANSNRLADDGVAFAENVATMRCR